MLHPKPNNTSLSLIASNAFNFERPLAAFVVLTRCALADVKRLRRAQSRTAPRRSHVDALWLKHVSFHFKQLNNFIMEPHSNLQLNGLLNYLCP